MKINTLFTLIICFSVFYSCDKELERPDRGFPGVFTGSQSNLTSDGFDMDFNIQGDISDITEYGFVWNAPFIRTEPTIRDLKLEVKEKPTQNNITTSIKWNIPVGGVDIRAYIRTSSKIIYGPTKKVETLGGAPPVISQITPSTFTPGDTLCITGEGFAQVNTQNTVTIDGEVLDIIQYSTTSIKVIAPIVNSPNPVLRVTSWGKTSIASISIGTSSPFISSLSRSQSGMDQLITIYGGNFSTDNATNSVRFEGENLTKEATVISSFKDSIIVRVPNLSVSYTNRTYDILVQVGNLQIRKSDLFEFLNPVFSENQELIQLCDTITVRGSNFSPIPENNSFIKTSEGVSINFLKSSPTELKFLYQEDIQFTNGNSDPNYIALHLMTNELFDRTELQIADASISSSSSTVINTADTDIIIEITGSGFSSFKNQFNTSVTVASIFTPSFEAEVVSSECDKVVIKIDKSKIGGGLSIDETWMLYISHPSGKINHDIILQIEGKRQPLKKTPNDLVDAFSSGKGFATDTKGYYLGITGGIYSYDPSLDTWDYIVNTLEGMNFGPVNNQVIGQLAIHTWDNNNELQVAALDLNNNTWIEYDTPTDGIVPPPGNYFDFSFNDQYYISGVDINEVWQFTPATNTWVQKNFGPNPNGQFQNGKAFQIGDKVYLYDGDKIVIYDPVADNWTTGASNNADLLFDEYTTAVINNKLYLISPQSFGAETIYSEYDPSTNSWTTLETLNDPAHQKWSFLFTIGNVAYMHQAEFTQNGLPYSLSDFWSYKPE